MNNVLLIGWYSTGCFGGLNHSCRLYVLWDPTFLNRSGHFAKVTVLPSWGGFSFSFLGPAHKSFHSPEQSFHSQQWVVGKQFHDWPSNQYQAVLSCICFQSRPCRTHILAASLGCVFRRDGPATLTLQIFLLCTRNKELRIQAEMTYPCPSIMW